MKYDVKIVFSEPLIASSPANKEVYKEFIQSRARKEAEATSDEAATLPAVEQEQLGWSVFHSDDSGLFLFDYKIKGFLKDSCEAVTGNKGESGLSAYKTKIDKWVFVWPRRIYLYRDGAVLKKPEGVYERPLRAMTMQGPRVTVKRSDQINVGCEAAFQIEVLPLGHKEINEKRLQEWFEYGRYSGFGEHRSGGYGRFSFSMGKAE